MAARKVFPGNGDSHSRRPLLKVCVASMNRQIMLILCYLSFISKSSTFCKSCVFLFYLTTKGSPFNDLKQKATVKTAYSSVGNNASTRGICIESEIYVTKNLCDILEGADWQELKIRL